MPDEELPIEIYLGASRLATLVPDELMDEVLLEIRRRRPFYSKLLEFHKRPGDDDDVAILVTDSICEDIVKVKGL